MNKEIRTYGIRGLMECMVSIPVGKAHMRVEFTGGILTSYGNTPAKYTTSDQFKQTVIENSPQFKSGRIVLLDRIPTGEADDKAHAPAKADDKDTEDTASSNNGDAPRLSDGKTVVEVGSLDDAKTYLNEKFGIPVRNLRSKKTIEEEAAQKDIVFKYQ